MNCFKAFAIAIVEFYKEFVVPSTCKYGKLGKGSYVSPPAIICGSENIYLDDNVRIHGRSHLLAAGGRIIIKKESGAASDLTIITSNHRQKIGTFRNGRNEDNEYNDVIIEEDVWIAANVTILSGARIGRGAILGAGSVIRGQKVPPYAIVIGNPAKVIGFRYTPEEILEHEKALYPESERLKIEELKKNLDKYVTKRIKTIAGLVKL